MRTRTFLPAILFPVLCLAQMVDRAAVKTETAGELRIVCENPGAWRFSLQRIESRPLVEILSLVAEAAEEGEVPEFSLAFSLPRNGIHHVWHPEDERFPCCWTRQESSFGVHLPLRANFDDDERNVLTFGVADALHAIDFSTDVGFADANAHTMDFKATFFTEPSAPCRRYETKIRLDARRLFWSEAVSDGARWIGEASGRQPAVPPSAACEPLYSSWYVFRQGVTQKRMDSEIERAAALGMRTVILDDGWQRERGDWQMDAERFPDLRAQVEKAHRLGMKYLLWLAVPHVSTNSPAYTRYLGKFLADAPNQWGLYVVDPRYPEVRARLVTRIRELMTEYDLDGFKLDFIDEFVVSKDDPAARTGYAGCDFKGVPEATERLLGEMHAAIVDVRPDALIEFRQPYVGPVVRQYGNMLRAGDCPGDFEANRYRTLALRVLAPESAVHSDMLFWRSDDSVSELKRQVWNVMFSTVQYSAWLEGLSEDHLKAVRETIDFLKAHRETLLKGALRPHRPELGYPWVEAEGRDERIIAVYDPSHVVRIPYGGKRTIIVNATTAESLVLDVKGVIRRENIAPSEMKTVEFPSGDYAIFEGPERDWTTNDLVFTGPWDLSSHGTVAIDCENTSAQDFVRLDVILSENQCSRSRMTMIPPGFKGEIDLDVCPRIDHPEVAARMRGMSTDPFMQDQWGDRVDPANVHFVKLGHHWSGISTAADGCVPTVRVFRVVAKDTSSKQWPAWYGMDAQSFFPFVDKYGQFRFKDWPGKVSSEAELKAAARDEKSDLDAHAGCADWDEYGGWKKGPKLVATGRFRLEKVDGKWWFVDPVGNLWWSHGVVRVTPSSAVTPLDGREDYFAGLPNDDTHDPLAAFYHTYDELLKPYYDKKGWKRTYDFSAANLSRKYGQSWRETYADLSHRRLRSWGFNTIANSSDRDIRLMNRTPWIERLETRGPKCREQQGEGWWHIPDPYHPEFRRYFREQLERRRAELTSPWCVGIFVDNEHDWRGMKDETVREYFKVIREEIKRLDPALLYFGCRFAGSTERIVRLCAEYSDAVSYNVYRFRIDTLRLPDGVDKPILIGEFHFGSTGDTGMFNPSLVQVENQSLRAEAYERYVTDALRHPNIVGTHWHQFSDQPVTGRFDGENFNVGFTDVCDRPYPEMIGASRSIGERVYGFRSSPKNNFVEK